MSNLTDEQLTKLRELKDELSEIDSTIISQISDKYPELAKIKDESDGKIGSGPFFEMYLLKLMPGAMNIVTYNKLTGEQMHELDAVTVINDKQNNPRLAIFSACLDIDPVNIEEHIYEVGMHAIRYGGFHGLPVAILPNFCVPEEKKNKVPQNVRESSDEATNVLSGEQIFEQHKNEREDKVLNTYILDRNAFLDDQGNPSIEAFEVRLKELFTKFAELSEGDYSFNMQFNDEPETDVTLDPILQRSHRSFDFLLKIIEDSVELQFKKELLKLDDCLFQWLGVRGEEFNNEWILIARIDVPAYESNIASKYRRTLYQYVLTAIKYAGTNFKMLVFHNYDGSLQDETKTLGNDLKLRVFTMNAAEYKAYSKSNTIGLPKLVKSWATGELIDDQPLIQSIREVNDRIYGAKVDLVYCDSKFVFDETGFEKGSSTKKMLKRIRDAKPKDGTKFVAKYKRSGQIREIVEK